MPSRRGFIGALGALAATPRLLARQAASVWGAGGGGRAQRAYAIRFGAARAELAATPALEASNGDEARYPDFAGNYSKGLPHDADGRVDPAAYRWLLRGLEQASQAALDRVPLGGDQKLVNPLAGVAYDLEGRDIAKLAAPPAPPLASTQRAAEAVEDYWMALCRDVPFAAYARDPLAVAAAAELSSLAAFGGPRAGGRVTAATLFRGAELGAAAGPYVSQLFLTPFAYGQYRLDGRITTFATGADYLADPASWLACQNGQGSFPPPPFDPVPRYFRCGRDIAAYVHSDRACEGFYNAGLRLYALNAPANPGNPYLLLDKQSPFATLGAPHFLTLQAEAALRAVKAVFRQKWFVHRTLRPEEFGGLLQAMGTGRGNWPLDRSVLDSRSVAETVARTGSRLLSQAFPEACPQHPSYTQAHGGVAGACATILKCAFDASVAWNALDGASLVESAPDGLSLVPYAGADAALMTVNGEINKLCANIALARNFAGVHWRSGYEAGLLLGEAMAISVLADQRQTYGEDFNGFVITKFDGTTVTV